MFKLAKKVLYCLCVCFVMGALVWQMVNVSRLAGRKRFRSLQEKIRQRLEDLSVDFNEHRLTTFQSSSLPKHFNQCFIPTNVQSACIDTIRSATSPPFCPLRELSQDCDLFKQLHDYDKVPSDEERDFPLAFGIKMHKNPEQTEQLLRVLYRPHNVYCIHVDRKSDRATFRTMRSIATCFPNVFLAKRVSLVYGGPQMVEAELILMKCALNTRVPWKYYFNLAGQEFPLRTNLEMVRILKMLNGSNDIASIPMPATFRGRITHVYKVEGGRLIQTDAHKQKPTFRAEIRKGTQYGTFSRGFVTSLLYDDMAKDVIGYFSDTYSSDETVWATINAYPGIPGGYPVDVAHTPNNQHLSRTVAWEFSDSYRCRGRYVRRVCVFATEDLPWLLSQPNLIANKFGEEAESYQAVTCLEAVLGQRERSRGITVDRAYVLNLPHVKFRARNALQ